MPPPPPPPPPVWWRWSLGAALALAATGAAFALGFPALFREVLNKVGEGQPKSVCVFLTFAL